MKPYRVQLSRKKGWRMPPNTVKVDRSTLFGNPYPVTSSRELSVAAFAHWLTAGGESVALLAKLELRGKNLACWCPLDQACHADVLLKIVNPELSDNGN